MRLSCPPGAKRLKESNSSNLFMSTFYLKGEKRERKKASGGEKKERKKKLTKLPGQPKRAMSSYMIWMNANRDRIKNDNPGFSIGEIAKKAGEEWKAMSTEDKSGGSSILLIADTYE